MTAPNTTETTATVAPSPATSSYVGGRWFGDADGWRLGLGVVQHRGVAAWLRVRSATPTPAPARPSTVEHPIAGCAAEHCQLEQFEGDFRRFASAIHQVACDV